MRRIYTVKQQWISHRDRDRGCSCLENIHVKLKKKLKFHKKKKEKKKENHRLGSNPKCQILGGNASKWHMLKELCFLRKKQEKNFQGSFCLVKKVLFH